jgi:hypothetical protein
MEVDMKSIIFAVVGLIFVFLMFIGDIDSFFLNGTGLELKKTAKERAYLINKKSGMIIINPTVVSYRSYGDYLVFLRMVTESYDCKDASGDFTIITNHTEKKEFWLIHKYNNSPPLLFDEVALSEWLKNNGYRYRAMKTPRWYKSNSNMIDKDLISCMNYKE